MESRVIRMDNVPTKGKKFPYLASENDSTRIWLVTGKNPDRSNLLSAILLSHTWGCKPFEYSVTRLSRKKITPLTRMHINIIVGGN